jgi:cytochrome c oxidase subunit II
MMFPLFPPAATETAQQVDALFSYLMAVCGVVLTAIAVVMTYFLFKYRRGKPANRSQRTFSTVRLELIWTVIPLMFFMSFFVWGVNIYHDQRNPPPDALEIHVIGKQWMWKIQHPTGIREINTLHVPVGRNIKLVMATQDVIHSFFLPAMRIKQDLVPGRYTTEWFRANTVGNFPIFCAEYCGTDHSFMVGRVIVMSPPDYEQWQERNRPEAPLEAQGAKLYRSLGCSGCHENSTIVRAPPLEGIYGKPVPLNNGSTVTADDRYLHDSIVHPDKEVAAGYEPVMPSYQGQVNEEQIFQLLAYLRSMEHQPPASASQQSQAKR